MNATSNVATALAAGVLVAVVTTAAAKPPCRDNCRPGGGTVKPTRAPVQAPNCGTNKTIRQIQDQIRHYNNLANNPDIIFVPNLFGSVPMHKSVFAQKLADKLRENRMLGKKTQSSSDIAKALQGIAHYTHAYRRRIKTSLLPELQKDLEAAQRRHSKLSTRLKNAQ